MKIVSRKWLAPALVALLAVATPGMVQAAQQQGANTGKKAEAQAAAEKKETKALKAAKEEARAKAREKGQQQVQAEREKVFAEAVAALAATRDAIVALEKKDRKAALAALEKVIGKLEIILARDPKLALAPVDVMTYMLDVHADVASVKKAVDESISLLKKGRVQDARAIVSGLASEIVIEVANIPLATYPDAIKAVVPLVEAEKYDEAKRALVAALNTLVITRTIVPLPIVRAESLLAQAETLAEKKDRGKADQKQLDDLLQAARQELQFAEVLGYGKAEDFKPLYAEIDKIEQKVKGGGHGKGFFDALKQGLEKLLARF